MIAKYITSKSSARARHYAWVLLTYFTDPDPRKQIDAGGLEPALTLPDYVKGEKPVTDAAQRFLYTGASVSGVSIGWADAADEIEHRLEGSDRFGQLPPTYMSKADDLVTTRRRHPIGKFPLQYRSGRAI
jgi:hypothetical protein